MLVKAVARSNTVGFRSPGEGEAECKRNRPCSRTRMPPVTAPAPNQHRHLLLEPPCHHLLLPDSSNSRAAAVPWTQPLSPYNVNRLLYAEEGTQVSQPRIGMPPSSYVFCDEIRWFTNWDYPTLSPRGRRLSFVKCCRRSLFQAAHIGSVCQSRSYYFFCKQARHLIDMKQHFSVVYPYQYRN